jgi:hypothetical protein
MRSMSRRNHNLEKHRASMLEVLDKIKAQVEAGAIEDMVLCCLMVAAADERQKLQIWNFKGMSRTQKMGLLFQALIDMSDAPQS